MNERNLFRKIALMAVGALLLLSVVQGLWVWRMYRDRVADFERRVRMAAYKSVYRSFRMDAIPGLQSSDRVQIDLADFTLYFDPNLLELDALEPYVLEVVSYLGDNGRVMMRRGDVEALSNPFVQEIEIDDDGYFRLHVYMDVPHAEFRREMSGLILSSVAIVLLMAALFYYLMRTWFRQKSLEEMRRDLTQNITHELKTPISVAMAANEALRNFEADSDPERRARYLEMVGLQLRELHTMVDRILSLSVDTKESYHKEPILLHPLVEKIMHQFRVGSRPITFKNEIPKDFTLQADRFHLQNVLQTLLDNALKYSDEALTIEISALRTAEGVELRVKDNGHGMESKHLNPIFEKFYRIPSGDVQNVRGFGLGLYYAKRVVEGHGGQIWAKSTLGRGTTIFITLPDNEIEEKTSAGRG